MAGITSRTFFRTYSPVFFIEFAEFILDTTGIILAHTATANGFDSGCESLILFMKSFLKICDF